MTILDFDETNGLTVHRIDSETKLLEAVKISNWKDDPGSTRLIISADISSIVIETLGSTYDVDPRLFRNYLTDYQWFHVRDPWYTFPTFKSDINHIPFFHAIYPRLFYLPDEKSVRSIQEDAGAFNVQRGVLLDSMGSWTEPKESRVGYLRSTSGFWERPSVEGKGSLGENYHF